MNTTNKPFRFGYILFNPQFILSVVKEDFNVKGERHFYVTVNFSGGRREPIRAIDELEQEGLLQDFLKAWTRSTSDSVGGAGAGAPAMVVDGLLQFPPATTSLPKPPNTDTPNTNLSAEQKCALLIKADLKSADVVSLMALAKDALVAAQRALTAVEDELRTV